MSPCLGADDGQAREAKQRKLNYSTKVFEGVPIIVKGETKKCLPIETTFVFRWWVQRRGRGAGQARVAGHTASQTPQGWICHPAHQGDAGWMGHYQLSKQSIQGLIDWTPILQSAANVVKTEYSTFTYFITSLSNGQTVTATDIVVSSKVVTTPPSIEATPVLQDWGKDQVSWCNLTLWKGMALHNHNICIGVVTG